MWIEHLISPAFQESLFKWIIAQIWIAERKKLKVYIPTLNYNNKNLLLLYLFKFNKWHIHCMYIWYRKYIFLCNGKHTNMKLVYVLTHALVLFPQWQSMRTSVKQNKKSNRSALFCLKLLGYNFPSCQSYAATVTKENFNN